MKKTEINELIDCITLVKDLIATAEKTQGNTGNIVVSDFTFNEIKEKIRELDERELLFPVNL